MVPLNRNVVEITEAALFIRPSYLMCYLFIQLWSTNCQHYSDTVSNIPLTAEKCGYSGLPGDCNASRARRTRFRRISFSCSGATVASPTT